MPPPSPTTTDSPVATAPGCTQFGSDSMRIVTGFGGVPSKVTRPATLPAVAGSTGLVTGALVSAGAAVSCEPPPHAIAASGSSVSPAITATLRTGLIHISQPLIITRRLLPRFSGGRGPASTSDP